MFCRFYPFYTVLSVCTLKVVLIPLPSWLYCFWWGIFSLPHLCFSGRVFSLGSLALCCQLWVVWLLGTSCAWGLLHLFYPWVYNQIWKMFPSDLENVDHYFFKNCFCLSSSGLWGCQLHVVTYNYVAWGCPTTRCCSSSWELVFLSVLRSLSLQILFCSLCNV